MDANVAIMSVFGKLKLRRSGITVSRSAKLINCDNMIFARGSIIEDNCNISGGESDIFSLSVGLECRFRNNVYLSARRGSIRIGNYCYFAHNDWIGGQGVIDIGDNSIFGPNVVIISSNHNLDFEGEPRFKHPEVVGKIVIGENVWVGANATILPGVSIGDNAVVGAGSVVTTDISRDCLAVGNPAKIMRELQAGNRNYLPLA